jgi:hypothetical protein
MRTTAFSSNYYSKIFVYGGLKKTILLAITEVGVTGEFLLLVRL